MLREFSDPLEDDEGDMAEIGRQRSNSAPAEMQRPFTAQPQRPETAAGLDSQTGRFINVMCRFRPENVEEALYGGPQAVEIDGNTIIVRDTARGQTAEIAAPLSFTFSSVMPSYTTQREVYHSLDPVTRNFFDGVNCSVLAYGQTGSGKTYTMMGKMNERTGTVESDLGIVPQLMRDIFFRADDLRDTHEVTLDMTFIELYLEQINDLLAADDDGGDRSSGSRKICRDPQTGNTYVTCVTMVSPQGAADAVALIQEGLRRRFTAATKSNKVSSRSHAVVILTLSTKDRETKLERSSQLYLGDLAGSEKVAKTGAAGLRLEESKKINASLFALGQVISALCVKQITRTTHVPYRDSKLTRLLENSIGGNSLTFIFITCSPSSYNLQETISSLRFGSKAQRIKTKPQRNEQRSVEELEQLLAKSKNECDELRLQVAMLQSQVRSADAAKVAIAANTIHTTMSMLSGVAEADEVDRRRRGAAVVGIVDASRRCPLTKCVMRDPVVALDGHTYERENILNHLRLNDLRSPMTNERLGTALLVPNTALRALFRLCDAERVFVPLNAWGAPRIASPFQVWDLVRLVVEHFPMRDQLNFARVSKCFASVVYDRDRWTPHVEEVLRAMPEKARLFLLQARLPAHKIMCMYWDTGGDSFVEKIKRVKATACLYSPLVQVAQAGRRK